MKKFEALDIATADMAFAAYGKTKEEMFENAAKALFSVMFETKEISAKEKRGIILEHEDDVILLHDFLSELLYLFDTEHIIFTKFNVKINNGKLTSEAFGEKYDEKKHKFIIDVKAITYHKMEIKKEKNLWKCVVIVDT
ncbi:MAG: archease [archaeon]